MQLNCKVNKKMANFPFQGDPPFLAKCLVFPSQVTQFLEGPTPTPYPQLCKTIGQYK